MENTHRPLKRSEQLKSLSREHHSGLLFSWKVKEGVRLGVSAERLKNYLNFFVNGHLIDHFDKEEKLLFNSVDDPVCAQAKKEHSLLKAHVQMINASPAAHSKDFMDFIEILNGHIRFEERVVFPLLEKVLDKQTLNSIHDELELADRPAKDEYPDEFWLASFPTD